MFAATSFANKKVGVFGLARSGISCAIALKLGGAEVCAWDDNEPATVAASAEGIALTNLHDVDFTTLDALVLSPGVPLTHPQPHWTVLKARAAQVEIIGDTEIFARELKSVGAKLVAITGTNGKSTTTALIGHVLRSAGLDIDVGGNIGLAVFNLRAPIKSRVYVLELSSYQIDLMPSLKPDVGILTNITPDHLDRHGSLENYATVKARMFAKMDDTGNALIGVDDASSSRIYEATPLATAVSVQRSLSDGISAPDGILHHMMASNVQDEIDLRAMPALKGRHNWQNACMAYGAGKALGITTSAIASAMHSFGGLAHRMQEIARAGKVTFVNDSKATNADAAEKALSSYHNIYWIVGGVAKAGGIEPLGSLFDRVHKAYLVGASAQEFAATLSGKVEFEICETIEKAVAVAASDAVSSAEPDPVVLLSPACASFDQYKNFELRGDAFAARVAMLPGVVMAKGDHS